MADRSDGAGPDAAVPTHPGIRLLAELTGVLSGSVFSEETLVAAVATLRSGVQALRCRIWVRQPDGGTYRAITAPGDDLDPAHTTRPAESFDAAPEPRQDAWECWTSACRSCTRVSGSGSSRSTSRATVASG